jgi:hypothetical protein
MARMCIAAQPRLTMPAFDPWSDAQGLARHLQRPDAELLVVIGAEAWCEKCRRLKPLFEALCASAMPVQAAWMWLDLEDHSDFLAGFIPPDLPLLLRWRAGVCVQVAVVEDIAVEGPLAPRVRMRPLVDEETADLFEGDPLELPSLWSEFARVAWASA